MDLMHCQPTIGGSAWNSPAEEGYRSWKRGDGCHDTKEVLIDSSNKPEVSDQETKQVLFDPSKKSEVSDEEVKQYYLERKRLEIEYKQFFYDASRKSDWTDEELQQIFAKWEGTDPNKKLTEREARCARELLAVWKDKGEVFVLPFDEFLEKVFISDEDYEKRCKEVKEARAAKKQANLKIAEAKKPRLCEVCMKVVDHVTFKCPYLKDIPNPESARVGKGYEICCHCCLRSDHGHPDGTWAGFAFKSSCNWVIRMRSSGEEKSNSESVDEDSEPDEVDRKSNAEDSETDDEHEPCV